jgi:oxygen-independent coproporphyrinogen-3 oxidase
MKPYSLYVHIPYCLQKCPYCDFNTYALSSIPERDYTSALLAELDYFATRSEWKGRPIQSIYFGGGTPSLFSARSVRKFIEEACALFPITENIELSIEANPGTVDAEKLTGYKDCGVNRISFGAQSLDATILKALGRQHTPDDIRKAVELSHSAGISNINLDLMYGAPGQTMEMLEADLSAYLELAPSHISPYGLTIEKGTPFYTSFRKGIMKLPPEEKVACMMERVNEVLPKAGFHHYEISNFARPGKEARHNLAYWNGTDYLGLGAGSHSCFTEREGGRKISARRWSNYALPNRYMQAAAALGHAEGWHDTLAPKDLMFEFFFLGLRKMDGVKESDFEESFGVPISAAYPEIIQILTAEGLLEILGGKVKLTQRGMLLADSVVENFSSPKIDARPSSRIAESEPNWLTMEETTG